MKYVALVGATLAVVCLGCDVANTPGKAPADRNETAAPRAAVSEAKVPTVAVHVFNRDGKLVGPVESPKVELSAADWRKRLSPEAFDVLRNQGTEAPGSGAFLNTDTDGVYCCAGCGLPLFSSDAKFHLDEWPSFFQPIVRGNVAEVTDPDGARIEIHCPRCGGHLGHVFNDGPQPTGLRYCVDSVSLSFTPHDKLASLADPAAEPRKPAPASKQTDANKKASTAVFASGCFWATEAAFAQIKGVIHVESGYSGGAQDTANYPAVCTGSTGHAESVQVTYDPSRVSYDQLLDVFFAAHDPTELDRQGNDVGPQYRSAIFYADESQKQAAEAKVQELTRNHAFPDPIVTAIEPLKSFFAAEKSHQNYVHDHPDDGYVRTVSIPKVEKVRHKYPELINTSE
jgi:peptide methionine sulfoxide reductase msrA/msrB